MAWHFLTITKCNAAIEALHKQLAAVGHPEGKPGAGAFRFRHIGRANAEWARLTALVASLGQPVVGETISSPPAAGAPLSPATPPQPDAERSAGAAGNSSPSMDAKPAPPVGQSISGQPAKFPASNPAQATGQVAGLPGTLSRYQVLSALELFPAVAVSGGESDEDLRAMLKHAAAEGGIRLPGDTEASPAALRQAALNKVLAAKPEPATGTWNRNSLAALVDAVCGVGAARNVTGQPSYYECGADSIASQMAGLLPGSHRWNVLLAEQRKVMQKRLAANVSPETKDRELASLKRFCASRGWRVPGLSMVGLPATMDPECAGRPKQMAAEQRAIDQFCAVLSGDVEAGRSLTAAAKSAHTFIAVVSGKPFTLGATVAPELSARDAAAARYPYSSIPRSVI